MATVAEIRQLIEGLPDDAEVSGWEQAGGSVALEAGGKILDLDFGWAAWSSRHGILYPGDGPTTIK
jgi:hypothetical protein